MSKKYLISTTFLFLMTTALITKLTLSNQNLTSNASDSTLGVTSETTSDPQSYPHIPFDPEEKFEEEVLPSVTPQSNTIKIGIVVDDYTNSNGTITSLEKQTGYTFSNVSVYKQFGSQFNSRLPIEQVQFIRSSGKRLVVAWEPWNPDEGNSQSRDFLSEISTGALDSYLSDFAQDIKAYGSPITIRFGHEMNGNWYPWGQRPLEYSAAYRYIHDFFLYRGVSNVTWMWSINNESVPTENISLVSRFYPGNEYVDVIGIDGFNFGSTNGSQWKSFDTLFYKSYSYLASTYSKPIVISETASSEEGGNKSLWIKEMFASLKSKYPRITEITWFNLIKETDWRIESTDSSLKAFSSH